MASLEALEEFFFGVRGVFLAAGSAVSRVALAGERRERLAQVLEDAAVVDDEAVVLALVHAVGARDGLHERMRLERLVQVERGEGRHVEPGEPHRAHDRDAERVLVAL